MFRYGTAVLLFLGVAPYLFADAGRNINQIVGDRAIGMAGAYAAVSDDPSGMYYNPAGIAYSSSSNISANVNTLQSYAITYDDVVAGEFDYVRDSFQVLPNFFGVIQPLGNYTVGFSSSIVDSVREKQSQTFSDLTAINVDKFVFNFDRIDTTYNVGPTVARVLDNNLAVGLSMHLHYRSAESISNQHIKFSAASGNNISWNNSYAEINEVGIRPKLGLIWSPMQSLSFGVSADKTFLISGNLTSQVAACGTDLTNIGCQTQSDPSITETAFERDYPWQVRMGGAWFPSNVLLVSADLIYNSPTYDDSGDSVLLSTVDGALGVEWYWSPKWALRSGLYTANANTPELALGSINQASHVDLMGATVSITRFNQGSSISLGALLNYGQGQSQLFPTVSSLLQTTTIAGGTVFFTTSYRY